MLVAIALVALKLPNRTGTSNPTQLKGQPSKLRRIDFIGSFLVALTIVSLLAALSLGGQNLPWSHPIIIGLGISSIALGAIFVTYEIKYALEPVFPPLLLLRWDVASAYIISGCQTAAQLGVRIPLLACKFETEGADKLLDDVLGASIFPSHPRSFNNCSWIVSHASSIRKYCWYSHYRDSNPENR